MQQQIASGARSSWFCSALVLALPAILGIGSASAEQPPSPCHPNPNAAANRSTVATHGDVINLPGPLKDRLIQLAGRPHTYLPFAGVRRSRCRRSMMGCRHLASPRANALGF